MPVVGKSRSLQMLGLTMPRALDDRQFQVAEQSPPSTPPADDGRLTGNEGALSLSQDDGGNWSFLHVLIHAWLALAFQCTA